MNQLYLTEFEELALKKIVKDYLIDSIYMKINIVSGQYGISNAEISKYIGWDPAGYNQKYNRSNDLRITTFVKIYVAIQDLIKMKESEMGIPSEIQTNIQLSDLITENELLAAELFNHISAAIEGREPFLTQERHRQMYVKMKPFVLVNRKSRRFKDREIDVFIKYFKFVEQVEEVTNY